MAKKKSAFGVNIGSSSLLLIFVVLCLVSFAALSIVSSNADFKLGQKVMERTERYYEVSNQAQEAIAGVDDALAAAYKEAGGDEEAYFAKVGHTSSFEFQISDLQNLEISLEILYPEKSGDPFYRITKYKVVTNENITYDNTLNLFQ